MAKLRTSRLHLSTNLKERVKELSCLYQLSKIAQQFPDHLDTMLAEMLKVMVSGWQHPECMQACILLDDEQYGAVQECPHFQQTMLNIRGEIRGKVVVYYKTDGEPKKGPLFLEEEQHLIDQIGLELSGIIERHEQRERERLLANKMQHSDRLTVLGELTAGIAHELNTPLGSMLGYAQLLIKSEENRQKKNDLQKIVNAALHARSIVKKLMFFSCEMPTQFKAYDLNILIKESVDLMKIQLREHQTQLQLVLMPDLPRVRLDAIQFSQVVFNLVLNALHAMPTGGKLSMLTTLRDDWVTLVVSDTGKGIAKAHLSKVFEPFYSTKPAGEGTGLGLAVVHGIIKGHGGAIRIDSEEKRGTTVTIQLKPNA
jgi:two-component system NtrC family sensor kinase